MGRTAQPKVVKDRARRRNTDHSPTRQRMGIPTHLANNPEYQYRWVNDKGLRISEAIANDYDFVNEKGEEVTPKSPSRHQMHVGTHESGESLKAYLMRKRKDWYETDKAEAGAERQEDMKQMQQEAETPSDPRRYKSKNVGAISLG